ncbi:MAG: DUF1232 domain-containing protein [Nitrospirae bacterium]|nr:DUF1232 domain-containing protein [Nitrospirota bacterium]
MFEKLKLLGAQIKREIRLYQRVLRDDRTPKTAKCLLGFAIGYLLLPFDIIPDFIPVIGHLDDLIVVPALVVLALKLVPEEVIEDCRVMTNKKSRG